MIRLYVTAQTKRNSIIMWGEGRLDDSTKRARVGWGKDFCFTRRK